MRSRWLMGLVFTFSFGSDMRRRVRLISRGSDSLPPTFSFSWIPVMPHHWLRNRIPAARGLNLSPLAIIAACGTAGSISPTSDLKGGVLSLGVPHVHTP